MVLDNGFLLNLSMQPCVYGRAENVEIHVVVGWFEHVIPRKSFTRGVVEMAYDVL